MQATVLSFDELTPGVRASAGGKGASLARMRQAGFPVPDGFVILPDAFEEEKLEASAWTRALARLDLLRGSDATTAFAVRSSAMGEDSAQASFAGEFESVLNLISDAHIHEAILRVQRSRSSERVQAYDQALGIGDAHQVAVIVQELIPAERAGVLFTANPVTGQRDEAVINAAWGLGESIVGGLVTPDTLVVDKADGAILSRETADKQVMTVRGAGEQGTSQQPVPGAKRNQPVLSDAEAAALVRLAVQIEDFFGFPVDIEWTYAGARFAIVQARPITALPDDAVDDDAGAAPLEWKLPKGVYAAVRNNIVELMADPLSPLFGTLGLAAVNASMHRLLTDFFNKPGLAPRESIVRVNDFAYYGTSLSAGQIVGLVVGGAAIMKRMFTGAVERWTVVGRLQYTGTVERWRNAGWAQLPSVELLDAARQLSEAAIDAYGSLVSGLIPAAWITEALFTKYYNLVIKRRDDPSAPVFLLGFDSTPIRADKSLYDLAAWAGGRATLSKTLRDMPAAKLAGRLGSDEIPAGVEAEVWLAWRSRFQDHLRRYGHTIYDLDFANPVPADDPTPLLETLKYYVAGEGADPYKRQESARRRREKARQSILGRLGGLRRKQFSSLLDRAQRYAPLREDGLADIGLAYPLLRRMLLELGRRFVQAGLVGDPDDVFWLTQAEVEGVAAQIDGGEGVAALFGLPDQRRARWRAARGLTPPLMLPELKVLGVDLAAIKSGRAGKGDAGALKGVGASPGRVTARARVLHGPEDFDQMQAGDVLVAPLTTPAWTPLFARAAAIVTDIGGPLSHGSIVAREYGIPAVLGTGVATKRIRPGQLVTIDGTAGTVVPLVGGCPQA